LIDHLLVSGEDKHSNAVVRLHFEQLLGILIGLSELDPFVLVGKSHALVRNSPIGLHLNHSFVEIYCLLVDCFGVQNVGVAEEDLVFLGIEVDHGSVPLHCPFHLFLVIPELEFAQEQEIEH